MAHSQNGVSIDYISVGCNRFSNAADCSPESLVAFGAGKFIALWRLNDVDNRGVYRTLPGHAAQVTNVKFLHAYDRANSSARSTGFVSGDTSGEVILWRSTGDEWKPAARLTGHASSISAIGVLRASNQDQYETEDKTELVVTGASDGCLRVWSVEYTGEAATLAQTLDLKGKYPLDIAISVLPGVATPIMAVACTDRRIQVWARQGSEFVHFLSLEGHEDWIRCLAFVTEPSRTDLPLPRTILASGAQDGYIRLWTITPDNRDTADSDVTANGSSVSDDLLDAFEVSLAEGRGTQLSTKAHLLSLSSDDGSVSKAWRYAVTFDALLIGHEGWVTGLHWHPIIPSLQSQDGAESQPSPSRQPIVLLSAASDNSLIMWSQDPSSSIWINRQRFGDIVGKGMGFFGALWGSNGRDVLAHGWNGSFHRWRRASDSISAEGDRGTWEPALAITGHSQPVKDLAWDPQGDYVMTLSSDQTTRIHGPWRQGAANGLPSHVTWHELARPQIHGYDLVTGAFLEPFRFVSAADEKVARVFDAPRTFVHVLQASGAGRDNLQADSRPSAATVPALGLSNKELSQEDASALYEDLRYDSARPPVESELASSTLWPEAEKIFGHGYELFALATSRDGAFVATSCKSSSPEHAVVRVYETTGWKQFGPALTGHALTVTRITFSPTGRYVLTVSRDRTWRLFERGPNGFSPVASEKAHVRIIWDCAWSLDDDVFVTAARDKTVKVWQRDAGKWRAIAAIKLSESATAVDLTGAANKGLLLAVGLETGQIEIYRASADSLSKWKRALVLDSAVAHVDQIHRICWQPNQAEVDIRTLAACSEDTSFRILNIQHL